MINIMQEIERRASKVSKIDHVLGRTLKQPFSAANSSARKIMFSAQEDQKIQLLHAEPPHIGSGYEDEFGRHASTFVEADCSMKVIGKVSRYSNDPNRRYVLLVQRKDETYDVIERYEYKYNTEVYGFLMNNDYLDSLSINSTIKKGDVVHKSKSYNKYNSRCDGINLLAAYLAIPDTTEDGLVVSKSAAKKLESPFIHKIQIKKNNNDIPLNLYGKYTQDNVYKIMPDIGEYIQDSILCGFRKHNKEEALYSLSYSNLSRIFMSDEIQIVSGYVADIEVRSNNPDELNNMYSSQIKYYYDEGIRYAQEICNLLQPIVDSGNKYTNELDGLLHTNKMILNRTPWVNDDGTEFTSTRIDITVVEVRELKEGDKLSDRFGSKGVISKVYEDDEMPRTMDGKIFDIIFSPIGPIGRENPGGLFEHSISGYGDRMLKNLRLGITRMDDFIENYTDFISMLSKTEGEFLRNYLVNKLSDDEVEMFANNLEHIRLSLEPISESASLRTLVGIRDRFKIDNQEYIYVSMECSDGSRRYVKSRRPITVGYKYIYRLKQYAYSKFSAVSLSATNIRNEPSRPKRTKPNKYKHPFVKTPIAFGNMETGDLSHIIYIYIVVHNLLLHSLSPGGRLKAKELLTGDPFNVDVNISDDDINILAQTLAIYIKTMGMGIVFKKKKKNIITPITLDVMGLTPSEIYTPISFVDDYFPIELVDKDFIETPIVAEVIKRLF